MVVVAVAVVVVVVVVVVCSSPLIFHVEVRVYAALNILAKTWPP